MSLYEISHDAEQDLQEIISYTTDNYGIAKMAEYVNGLEQCTESIAKKQGHYREVDVNNKIVRVKHCQHHYIFGLVRQDLPLLVIAVFHERMDLMKRLSNRLS